MTKHGSICYRCYRELRALQTHATRPQFPDQGWVQLHKITSITITITLKYKFQLQLHLHNVILNYTYNYTMFISITITITDQFFSRKLHLYLWNFLLIDLGCFPDIWYHIMCGTRNHRKQGYSILLVQNAHVNFLFFFT